jgi:uncharacterized protein (AIM24 family)
MISISRDGPGHIVPIHLERGQSLDVREHQFLAATSTVDYSFRRVKGISNLLFGGTGLFIDTFHAARDNGIVWLHGYPAVTETPLRSTWKISSPSWTNALVRASRRSNSSGIPAVATRA